MSWRSGRGWLRSGRRRRRCRRGLRSTRRRRRWCHSWRRCPGLLLSCRGLCGSRRRSSGNLPHGCSGFLRGPARRLLPDAGHQQNQDQRQHERMGNPFRLPNLHRFLSCATPHVLLPNAAHPKTPMEARNLIVAIRAATRKISFMTVHRHRRPRPAGVAVAQCAPTLVGGYGLRRCLWAFKAEAGKNIQQVLTTHVLDTVVLAHLAFQRDNRGPCIVLRSRHNGHHHQVRAASA